MKPEALARFTDKIISNLAQRFDLDTNRIKALDGFENYVCESTRQGHDYVLRISDGSRRSLSLVQAELDWVNYLAEHGASVCVPLCSRNGQLVETLTSDGRTFMGVVFEKAPGGMVRKADQTSEMTRNRGRLLGKIHTLSKKYDPPKNRPVRHNWYEDEDFADFDKFLRPDDAAVAAKIHEHVDRLKAMPVDRDSYGLIHMDAHTGNIFFHGDRPTIFDFDDCAYDFYMADIAISLFYALLFLPENRETKEHARRFLGDMFEGYHEYNHLEKRWLDLIPLILKRREMILYVAVNRGMDLDNPGDFAVRYMDGRRERIEGDVPYLDIDFTEFA